MAKYLTSLVPFADTALLSNAREPRDDTAVAVTSWLVRVTIVGATFDELPVDLIDDPSELIEDKVDGLEDDVETCIELPVDLMDDPFDPSELIEVRVR